MRCATLALLLIAAAALPAHARIWTDNTGKHTQQAELIDFDQHTVILKKAEGNLVAVPIERLSDADQEYLKSAGAKTHVSEVADAVKDRTWHMIEGSKLVGRVIEYARREVVITRKDSKLWVNDKLFATLPELHQLAVMMLVNHSEKKQCKTAKDIEDLIVIRKGEPLKFQVEGVLLQLATGETFPVPFFLFSDKDMAVLKPGWDAWVKVEKDEAAKQRESAMLRTVASEYQRNREIDHRIQYLQLASQWFDLWEVGLVAPNGDTTSVVIPARDSLTAEMAALSKYPNGRIIGTRKIERRY